MRKIIPLFATCVIFAGCSLPSESVLVDVRTPEEYSKYHLPGAINLPNAEDISSLNKNQNITLYCTSGKRSKDAADKLSALGYKVKDIGGMFTGFYSDGLEVFEDGTYTYKDSSGTWEYKDKLTLKEQTGKIYNLDVSPNTLSGELGKFTKTETNTTYTDTEFDLTTFVSDIKNASVKGVGEIKDNIYISNEVGHARITINDSTFVNLEVRDKANRKKELYYYHGDILENGKVYKTTDGKEFKPDFYTETQRGEVNFSEVIGEPVISVEVIAGCTGTEENLSQSVFEIQNDKAIYNWIGDTVFECKTKTATKTVLVHSWCDCGN